MIKRGPQGETAYVNQYFTIRNGTIGTKHVFVGPTRIVLQADEAAGGSITSGAGREGPLLLPPGSHLGSTGLRHRRRRAISSSTSSTSPSGETWVEESSNTQRTPYLFTGKELDEETGLYYFGARYYDPRLSQWTTNDPALDEYLMEEPPREASDRDAAQIEPGAYFRLSRLRGVYAPANLGLYGYAWQSPVVVHDPDGRKIVFDPKASATFKAEYARARKYLKGIKAADAVFAKLEKSKEVFTIREGFKLTDTAYNPHSKEIVWNPYSALRTSNGTQTPALGLLHEGDHAAKHLQVKTTAAYNKLDYHKEELRVIKGSETSAAKARKEGTRTTPNVNPSQLYKVQHSDMR